MIEILPMDDRELERSVLENISCAGPNARVLAMREQGKTLGTVALELEGGVLRILNLAAENYDFSAAPKGETTFILDSLMRSAASYGETFGADQIETAFPDFFGFFQARGFDCDETHAFTLMSTIVRYGPHG